MGLCWSYQPRMILGMKLTRREVLAVRRVVLPLLLALLLATPVEAASLSVKITSLPAVYRGHDASATVVTKAGARCAIRVVYKTGVSRAKGLGTKAAPANGRIKWTWKVPQNATRGSWPVTVTCTKGSATGSGKKSLVVK
jgi:hypothetical protein